MTTTTIPTNTTPTISVTTTDTTTGTGSSRWRALLWFCTGAALAIAAAGITTAAWSADAAPGDTDTTFVPTPGCRLLDTRPGPTNIGNRTTPLGPGDTHTVPVHGTNGRCTGPLTIPTDATGVALNATAVGATTSSNIRLYPANLVEPPLLSNLNVTAGAPPTPNKVDVQLSPDGAITAYNANGTVHLVLDVVGYYTTNSLTDLHQRVAQLETNAGGGADPAIADRLDDLDARTATQGASIERNSAEIGNLDATQPFAVSRQRSSATLSTSPRTVVVTNLTAPVNGHVIASSAVNVSGANTTAACSITAGDTVDTAYTQSWTLPETGANLGQLAGTRRFHVDAGETINVKLVCELSGSGGAMALDSVLTAIFTPAT